MIWGLKDLAQDGVTWPPVLAILAGLALAAAFVHRQGRLADPLIDLELFRAPAFSAALATYTLGFFVNFALLLFVAQYLQSVLGLSPLVAGAWTVPGALGFVAGAMATPQLVKRVRAPFVVSGGLLLAAAGFALLTRLDGELALLVTGSVIVSLGLAAVFTLATDLMVGTAPPERAGAASAIAETGSEFGGALGIAVLGLIGTAVYRDQVGVDTLGEVSDPALLATARDAFTQGFQVTAAVSTAVVLAAALVAVALLPSAASRPAAS